MANLSISMHLDDVVRIQPIGEISSSEWESVLDWWAIGGRYDINATFIDVPITAFTQRKLWLRENWKNLGNDLVNCCQFRSNTKESFSIVNHCSNMG